MRVLILIFTGLALSIADNVRTKRAAKEDIQKVNNEAMVKLNEGKIDEGVKHIYSQDAIYIDMEGKKIEGQSAIIEYLKASLAAYKVKNLRGETDEIILSSGEGDGAVYVELGKTMAKATMHGKEQDMTSRHLTVWKKTPTGLKVLVDGLFPGDGTQKHDHTAQKMLQMAVQMFL